MEGSSIILNMWCQDYSADEIFSYVTLLWPLLLSHFASTLLFAYILRLFLILQVLYTIFRYWLQNLRSIYLSSNQICVRWVYGPTEIWIYTTLYVYDKGSTIPSLLFMKPFSNSKGVQKRMCHLTLKSAHFEPQPLNSRETFGKSGILPQSLIDYHRPSLEIIQ